MIALIGEYHSAGWIGLNDTLINHPISGCPTLSKGIDVSNEAVNPNGGLFPFNLLNLLVVEQYGFISTRHNGGCSARRHGARPRWLSIFRKPVGGKLASFEKRDALDFVGGRVAGIAKVQNGTYWTIYAKVYEQAPIHVDVCSQLPLGSILSDLQLPSCVARLNCSNRSRGFELAFASFPQFVGRAPKSRRERGQDSGKQNDEKSVVFVNSVDQPFEADKKRAMKVATVFGILAFYGLCAAFGWWMAGRKR
jgi:hypothetical protein